MKDCFNLASILKILKKFETIQKDQICISIVTYVELQFGVEKRV